MEDFVSDFNSYELEGGVEGEGEVSLEECLTYLRNNYYYCYYCGARYNDTNDLDESCPGLHEDDH